MKGKRYFKCEPNKGMFILAKEIQRKLAPEELIQKIVKKRIINQLHEVNKHISNHNSPQSIRLISKH